GSGGVSAPTRARNVRRRGHGAGKVRCRSAGGSAEARHARSARADLSTLCARRTGRSLARRAARPRPAERPAVKRVAVVLLFCALPARAWVRTKTNGTGLCVWWQSRGHGFQIDSQGTPDAPTADTFAAIRSSLEPCEAHSSPDSAFPLVYLATDQ